MSFLKFVVCHFPSRGDICICRQLVSYCILVCCCRFWLSRERNRRGCRHPLPPEEQDRPTRTPTSTLRASSPRCPRRYGNRCWRTWTTAWWRCCHLSWRRRRRHCGASSRRDIAASCRNDSSHKQVLLARSRLYFGIQASSVQMVARISTPLIMQPIRATYGGQKQQRILMLSFLQKQYLENLKEKFCWYTSN